jgi:hypothetical protein
MTLSTDVYILDECIRDLNGRPVAGIQQPEPLHQPAIVRGRLKTPRPYARRESPVQRIGVAAGLGRFGTAPPPTPMKTDVNHMTRSDGGALVDLSTRDEKLAYLHAQTANPHYGRNGRANATVALDRYETATPLIRHHRLLSQGWSWLCPDPTCQTWRMGYPSEAAAQAAWLEHAGTAHPELIGTTSAAPELGMVGLTEARRCASCGDWLDVGAAVRPYGRGVVGECCT